MTWREYKRRLRDLVNADPFALFGFSEQARALLQVAEYSAPEQGNDLPLPLEYEEWIRKNLEALEELKSLLDLLMVQGLPVRLEA